MLMLGLLGLPITDEVLFAFPLHCKTTARIALPAYSYTPADKLAVLAPGISWQSSGALAWSIIFHPAKADKDLLLTAASIGGNCSFPL